jgi:hypothetical protein
MTVKHFLLQKGLIFKFIKFKIKKDLKQQKNPIRTYTKKLKNNARIVVSGANVIAEHFHLFIKNTSRSKKLND